MPWEIVAEHEGCPDTRPWAVVETDTQEVEGCHPTFDEAQDQLEALEESDDNNNNDNDEDEEMNLLASQIVDATVNKDSTIRFDANLEGPLENWTGVLAVEDVETGDGREFAPGSLQWPDLEETILNVMWQKESQPGHEGSIIVGRINRIERDGNLIRGWGVIKADEPITADIRNGIAGGISIDVDSVKDNDVELIFPDEPDGADEDDEDEMIFLFGPPPDKVVFHNGRIRGATLVSVPAFVEANIHLIPEDEEGDSALSLLTGKEEKMKKSAVVAAGSFPVEPPSLWFQSDTDFDGPQPWQVRHDGQVFGHLALWSTCHTTFPDKCITPPREGDYPYFMRSELMSSEGEMLGVGPITLGTGHAALRMGAVPAVKHYDDTGLAVADVAVGEDRFGIWVRGALRPNVNDTQVRELRAASLSGDWRRIGGQLRLVAVLAVNTPGFPVPRMKATMSSGDSFASMVAAGALTDPRVKAMETAMASEDEDGTIRVRRIKREQ